MVVDPLRLYLLAGLIAHKLLWEWMKRGRRSNARSTMQIGLVKAVKIAILTGIVVQTVLPDIFPISSDPQALRVTGALLFTLGLAIAVAGRVQLGSNWSDIETAGILGKQAVVSHGIYRYLRHPIYVGDLILLVGLELALNSWLVLGAIALVPVVLRQAIQEERTLAAALPGYADYCTRTKRFIPFVA
jgi:protein-S-isoprenylcysteine O-methyltransferase Ste14